MHRRPIIIVLLLLACLVLVGVLGWQSWRLQVSNDAAARAVQRDYANLAADELGRRMTAALGYRGYFQVISRLADPPDASAIRQMLANDPDLETPATLVDLVFVFRDGELSADPQADTAELRQLLAGITSRMDRASGPYGSISAADDLPQVIYAVSNDATVIVGFTVSRLGVAEYLRATIDARPLLPASLGDGQVTNDRLFIEVQDNTGQVLIQDAALFDNAVMVDKVMGADYQGVVDGFRISIAVDPGVAGSLLIGGLPAEQLPLLAVVMVLSVALLLTAIWLFRREQAVMQMRVDFVSQVSHELRTPLTQIRMFAETLLLDRARSPDEQRRSLQIIDRESRRLSHLVENILRFSSISDAVPVNVELQPLAPVLEEVCEATEMMHSDVTVSRQLEESMVARFDDDALRQVLLNLLDNAVKYGPKGQTVNVRVSQQGGFARVEIIDQGPGIPRAERDRVWDAFYRPARERTTAISGAGIGLAVVRDLMHAMGGRCRFEETGAGAHVVIELPAEHGDD